jgi:hypothetical protein
MRRGARQAGVDLGRVAQSHRAPRPPDA